MTGIRGCSVSYSSGFLVTIVLLTLSPWSAQALDSYNNSCASEVSSEVLAYLGESANESAVEVLSSKTVRAGANEDGEWSETYEVALSFHGVNKSYVATLDESCSLVSLQSTPSWVGVRYATPYELPITSESTSCETYEDDCTRDNDEDGFEDNGDNVDESETYDSI